MHDAMLHGEREAKEQAHTTLAGANHPDHEGEAYGKPGTNVVAGTGAGS